MSAPQPWTRSAWTDAAQIAGLIDPDDVPEGAAQQQPHHWHAQLVEQGRLGEAVIFLAHALPRYECVAWGAQALLDIGAIDRYDPLTVATLRWIDLPGDALRREAGDLADSTRRNSAARMLAHAVAFSGGSLAPPDLPAVQPPPGVCAAFVSGAILDGVKYQPDPDAALLRAIELGEAMAVAR